MNSFIVATYEILELWHFFSPLLHVLEIFVNSNSWNSLHWHQEVIFLSICHCLYGCSLLQSLFYFCLLTKLFYLFLLLIVFIFFLQNQSRHRGEKYVGLHDYYCDPEKNLYQLSGTHYCPKFQPDGLRELFFSCRTVSLAQHLRFCTSTSLEYLNWTSHRKIEKWTMSI